MSNISNERHSSRVGGGNGRAKPLETTIRLRVDPVRCSNDALMKALGRDAIGVSTATLAGSIVYEISLCVRDECAALHAQERLQALPGVTFESFSDPVFDLHRGGKIAQRSTTKLRSALDLERVYTPGVARVVRAIEANPALASGYTSIGNSVGIFTNGSRVLGLGDTGVVASMPVMEGKAMLYRELAGVNATPVLVDSHDVDTFVSTVVAIQSTFAVIHLEDISSPQCFAIQRALRERLSKPVFHDDQDGTAVVALAGVLNACRWKGLPLCEATVLQIGAGAAGSAIARLLLAKGVGRLLIVDPQREATDPLVSAGATAMTMSDAMQEASVVVAATGRKGLISPELVRPGQVILALSNPGPEIEPKAAVAAGAFFAADGRGINNALAFPGIVRGLLDARAPTITTAMLLAASDAIADLAPDSALVPDVLSRAVHAAVASAVAREGTRSTAQTSPCASGVVD